MCLQPAGIHSPVLLLAGSLSGPKIKGSYGIYCVVCEIHKCMSWGGGAPCWAPLVMWLQRPRQAEGSRQAELLLKMSFLLSLLHKHSWVNSEERCRSLPDELPQSTSRGQQTTSQTDQLWAAVPALISTLHLRLLIPDHADTGPCWYRSTPHSKHVKPSEFGF